MNTSQTQKKKIKKEYILFKLSDEFYSVKIETLDQIIHTPSIRHVPNLPEYIIGVIDIEEQIVPVLDLKKRMKLTKSQADTVVQNSFILIFEQESRLVGFTADEIFELKEIEAEPQKEFTCIPEEIHIFSDGTFRIEDDNFISNGEKREELIVVLSLKKVHDIIKKELGVNGDF